MIEFMLFVHCILLGLFYRLYRKRSNERNAIYERQTERWAAIWSEMRNKDKEEGTTDG